jgi:hypothetical protein
VVGYVGSFWIRWQITGEEGEGLQSDPLPAALPPRQILAPYFQIF